MLIGLYDYDLIHYPKEFKPSFELMAYSSYYKRKKHIVKMIFNETSFEQYDLLIIKKDSLKGKISEKFLKGNFELIGKSFTQGGESSLPVELYNIPIDTSIYRGIDPKEFGDTQKKIFTKLMGNVDFIKISEGGRVLRTKVSIPPSKRIAIFDKNVFKNKDVFNFIIEKYQGCTIYFVEQQEVRELSEIAKMRDAVKISRISRLPAIVYTGICSLKEFKNYIQYFDTTCTFGFRKYDEDTGDLELTLDLKSKCELLLFCRTQPIAKIYPISFNALSENEIVNVINSYCKFIKFGEKEGVKFQQFSSCPRRIIRVANTLEIKYKEIYDGFNIYVR